MNNSKYHMYLEATSECKNKITKYTNGLCQRGVKGATKDCFIFDSWFSLKILEGDAMGVGTDIIGMVKTNKKYHVRIPLRS